MKQRSVCSWGHSTNATRHSPPRSSGKGRGPASGKGREKQQVAKRQGVQTAKEARQTGMAT
eukprot:6188127-Prorocentrum_lima.AAC.1